MAAELPAVLLSAIASEAGSQVTLVIGAGCSLEPPTCLPLSKDLSHRAHDELIADHVIAPGSCGNPDDLSVLAETVARTTGSQADLVRALPRARLRAAEPNRGYLNAAALLREGAVGDVVTLNFDLAQTTAVADLGGDDVAILDGPEFHDRLGRANVVYLHRNVNQPDPDLWILTREAMRSAWERTTWQAVIARRSAAAPVVLFAGLGSPADVLENSVREIRAAIENEVFLAEPDDKRPSPFLEALGIEADRVICIGWVDLMEALAERVAVSHRQQMLQACRSRSVQEGWGIDDWSAVQDLLGGLRLLDLGHLRARWTLRQSRYSPSTPDIAEQLAQLFAVIQLVVESLGYRASLAGNGSIVFSDEADRPRSTVAFVTGRGARSANAIDAEIERHRRYVEAGPLPSVYVLAGVDRAEPVPSAPGNIAVGEADDELVGGWRDWSTVFAPDICASRELEQLIT